MAADVGTVLAGVVDAHGPLPGRPAAGKTGTQQYGDGTDTQDAWMAGYAPQLAAVVWIGHATPAPIRDMTGRPINGEDLPFDLWRDFLAAALADEPVVALPAPAHLGRTDVGDARPPPPGRPPRSGVEATDPPAHGPGTKPTGPVATTSPTKTPPAKPGVSQAATAKPPGRCCAPTS